MALPQDGQDANGLTKVTQIPAGKELMFIDPTTNEGGIITLEDLTKQILNGLTSQAFALDAGQMTLPAALNYLYGKSNLLTYIGEGPDSGQNERAPSYDFTNEDTGFYLVLNTNNNAKEDYRFGAFCIVLHVKNHDSIAFSNCTASSTERVFSANGKILYGTSLSWQCRLMVYKINLTI